MGGSGGLEAEHAPVIGERVEKPRERREAHDAVDAELAHLDPPQQSPVVTMGTEIGAYADCPPRAMGRRSALWRNKELVVALRCWGGWIL